MTIGMKILSSLGINEERGLIMETIKAIYKAVANEYINGFLYISLL